MNRVLGSLLAGIVVLGLALAPTRVEAKEDAICLVCKVREGKSELEEVKVTRDYAGSRYGFCSQKCAKQFDEDPIAYLPPSFPRAAPRLSVLDLDGSPLTWEKLKGKVVLLDFWATWCAPCRKAMPELQALHEKYSSRGFSVVGVSIDEGKAAAKVRRFVSSRKITYPIAVDSEKSPTWERFHVKAVPAAFLVDREGRVVAQWTGAAADPRELEGRLGALLVPVD